MDKSFIIEPILKDLNDVEVEKIGKMQRQMLFNPSTVGNPRLRVAVNEAEPGASAQPHVHPGEEIVITIAGEAVVKIADKQYHLKPDTALMIPPNVEHYATAGSTGWKAIAIFCDECNFLSKK